METELTDIRQIVKKAFKMKKLTENEQRILDAEFERRRLEMEKSGFTVTIGEPSSLLTGGTAIRISSVESSE